MIESVDFWARRQAEDFRFSEAYAVISITDVKQAPARISGADEVLRLEFYDLTEPAVGDARFGIETLFSEHQALLVEAFVARIHAQREPRRFIVHCEAGVRRSAAIALFVAQATGCRFHSRSTASLANTRVLRVFADTCGVTLVPPPLEKSEGGILLFGAKDKSPEPVAEPAPQ